MSDGSEAAELLTELVLTLFRTNNAMLVWGDRLVQPAGLTSARWQVMGTIAYADRPRPVAWLARDLGANRQNVQRIVNELEREGLVAFETNPNHKRAQLVRLTQDGRTAYGTAVEAWYRAADELASALPREDMETTTRVLVALRDRLAPGSAGAADEAEDTTR